MRTARQASGGSARHRWEGPVVPDTVGRHRHGSRSSAGSSGPTRDLRKKALGRVRPKQVSSPCPTARGGPFDLVVQARNPLGGPAHSPYTSDAALFVRQRASLRNPTAPQTQQRRRHHGRSSPGLRSGPSSSSTDMHHIIPILDESPMNDSSRALSGSAARFRPQLAGRARPDDRTSRNPPRRSPRGCRTMASSCPGASS